MKKIQIINSNERVVFEGTFNEYEKFIRNNYLNDSDTTRIINY